MIRSAIIVVLLVFVAVLADRVAREENQRDALAQGMCRLPGGDNAIDLTCLSNVQTRASWGWQLLYGVTEPLPPVSWTSPPTQ